MEELVKQMKEKLDKIALVILGDPTDERNPGVMIRLDRLEQADRLKTRVMWVLAVGIITVISKVLLSLF